MMSEAADDPQVLRAGPLTADFFPGELFLRNIRFGGTEVLRGVYLALRDQDWNTPVPRVRIVSREIGPDGFDLSLSATWVHHDINYVGLCRLQGTPEGEILYQFRGTARSDFLKNRIGLLVLHGAQVAGLPVEVEHVDGARVSSVFPDHIAPHQPFRDIRSLEHQICPEGSIRVRFEGNIFEMEDQRNWTDASFKTYSTPLAAPFPVRVRTGDTVEQSIRVQWRSRSIATEVRTTDESSPLRLLPDPEARPCRLPAIGLEKEWGDNEPYGESEIAFLNKLNLGHLRIEVHLGHPQWVTEIESGDRLARALDVPLELALFLVDPCDQPLTDLLRRLRTGSIPVARWLLVHEADPVPADRLLRVVEEAIHASGLGGLIAVGTNANFAELNRNRPSPGLFGGLCYAINPQVHTSDDRSVMETLPMHARTSMCARKLLPDCVSIVSPITLTQRFNPVAGPDDGPFTYAETPDPRQKTGFGAVWTAGSILHCALGGTPSGTWFKTRGPAGVMKKGASSQRDLYPLYHVIRNLAGLGTAVLEPLVSTRPGEVEAAVVTDGSHRFLFVINYAGEMKRVELAPGPDLPRLRSCRFLDREVVGPLAVTAYEDWIGFELPARSSCFLLDSRRTNLLSS